MRPSYRPVPGTGDTLCAVRITHFGHACVLLETGTARLLLDPGVWSHGFEDLRDRNVGFVSQQLRRLLGVVVFDDLAQ